MLSGKYLRLKRDIKMNAGEIELGELLKTFFYQNYLIVLRDLAYPHNVLLSMITYLASRSFVYMILFHFCLSQAKTSHISF